MSAPDTVQDAHLLLSLLRATKPTDPEPVSGISSSECAPCRPTTLLAPTTPCQHRALHSRASIGNHIAASAQNIA
eukprot:757477-Rhodomonas_salina.6